MRLALGTPLLAALLICLAAHPPASAALVQCRSEAEALVYAFESGPLRLNLRARASHLTLDLLAAPAGPNQVTASPADGLWLIKLTGPDGEKSLTDADATGLTVTTAADRAVLCWLIPLPGAVCQVTMTVRIAEHDPLSYWSLEVATPDPYQLADVEFPRLTNLRLCPGSKLAIPWCDGVEYDLRAGMGYGDVYPSMLVSMQFIALYADGAGVYIAAHDPAASAKGLRARAREEGVEVVLNPWPESGGATWRPGYETAVGVFHGDWRQAAAIYRAFAATTPWWRASASQPTPGWFRDMDLWLLNDATSFDLDAKACLAASEYYAGVRRGIHWYNWYESPGSMSSYPDFPAREGFAAAVKQMTQAGYKVMPYMDGRLWSKDNPSWQTEHAEGLAVRHLDGSVFEDYTRCGVMCSWLSALRNAARSRLRSALDDAQADCRRWAGASRGVGVAGRHAYPRRRRQPHPGVGRSRGRGDRRRLAGGTQ